MTHARSIFSSTLGQRPCVVAFAAILHSLGMAQEEQSAHVSSGDLVTGAGAAFERRGDKPVDMECASQHFQDAHFFQHDAGIR